MQSNTTHTSLQHTKLNSWKKGCKIKNNNNIHFAVLLYISHILSILASRSLQLKTTYCFLHLLLYLINTALYLIYLITLWLRVLWTQAFLWALKHSAINCSCRFWSSVLNFCSSSHSRDNTFKRPENASSSTESLENKNRKAGWRLWGIVFRTDGRNVELKPNTKT